MHDPFKAFILGVIVGVLALFFVELGFLWAIGGIAPQGPITTTTQYNEDDDLNL